MPAELKEKLEQAAAANHRSITAELVSRLQESFSSEPTGPDDGSGLVDIVLDTDGLPVSWDEIRAHVGGINQEGKFNVYEQRVIVITPDLVSSQLRQDQADRIARFYHRTGRKPPKHLQKPDE